MAHPILMPKPGQMTEECAIVAWHKAEGDAVRRGDVLFEIETDKSNIDVEAFDEGTLLRIVHQAGEVVPVNAVCAFVGQPGESLPDEVDGAAVATPERAADVTPEATTDAPPEIHDLASTDAEGSHRATLAEPGATPDAARDGSGARRNRAGSADGAAARAAISPRAARLAASAGIDVSTIRGARPGARIVERDVQAAIAAARALPDNTVMTASTTAAVSPELMAGSQSIRTTPTPAASAQPMVADDEELRPLTPMRRRIAARLLESTSTIPQFSVTVRVDMTRLLELRQEQKAAGVALSVTDFIMLAAAQTLVEFPDVNSRTDGNSMWLRRRVHLGLAVTIPNGLLVPVIRDAHLLTVQQIHERSAELVGSARAGRLTVDDMSGSTFTVTNLGMFEVDEFTAIINPGEAAILAVSSVVPTPTAVGATTADGIIVRQLIKLTLAADHRLVDGELAARFLNALRRRLEDVSAIRRQLLND